MEILKFTLKGKNTFFEMSEVNTYYYLTYGNTHRVALLGIFETILEYNGYAQMAEEDQYPEFYERLKDISISIVSQKGNKEYIPKKVQSFNNSVGYASQEQGGDLIVKQQWLENPCWGVYVKIDSSEAEAIKKAIMNHTCVYVPYPGSNDHPADICDAEVLTGEFINDEEIAYIDSLSPAAKVELDHEDNDVTPYKYSEYLPIALDEHSLMYCMERFYVTNIPMLRHECGVCRVGGKDIIFY